MIASIAETNRAPFDLAEDESELVAGYKTEYSGFRWSLYFLAEYANMIVVASVGTTLFLGGWLRPFPNARWLAWLDAAPALLLAAVGAYCVFRAGKQPARVQSLFMWAVALACIVVALIFALAAPLAVAPLHFMHDGLYGAFWFLLKVSAYIYLFMWLRFTLPRFRFDQLMRLGWHILIPLALINVVDVAIALAARFRIWPEPLACHDHHHCGYAQPSWPRCSCSCSAGTTSIRPRPPPRFWRIPPSWRTPMLDSVIFYFFASIAVISAALMITRRNAIHSAVFSHHHASRHCTGIFLQLRAGFLFIAQIILYVGGIMVLFIFVIMLVRLDVPLPQIRSRMQKWIALFVALAVGVEAAVVLFLARKLPGQGLLIPNPAPAEKLPPNTEELAKGLFGSYLLPFEIASVLLLVAMVGAVVMAKKRTDA